MTKYETTFILEPGLDETAYYDPPNFAFSNGVHVCEVEVDPDTGSVELVSYHAVDDIGTVINPMIVEGQLHGAVAQGLGQALGEACAYDGEGSNSSGMLSTTCARSPQPAKTRRTETAKPIPKRTPDLAVIGCPFLDTGA